MHNTNFNNTGTIIFEMNDLFPGFLNGLFQNIPPNFIRHIHRRKAYHKYITHKNQNQT